LEDTNQLEARRSALDDDLEDMEEDEEEGEFKVPHSSQSALYFISNWQLLLLLMLLLLLLAIFS